MRFNCLLLLLATLTSFQWKGLLATDTQVCRNGMLYPADSIDEYYYCVQGVLQHGTCPEGSYFDANFLMCRHGQPPAPSGDGSGSVVTSGKCQRWGLAADLTDCNSYYHCAAKDVDMERRSCNQGQIFDVSKFTCVVGQC